MRLVTRRQQLIDDRHRRYIYLGSVAASIRASSWLFVHLHAMELPINPFEVTV